MKYGKIILKGGKNNHKDHKIHFVEHSLEGLFIRSYLGESQINNLGNVVVIGSPNKGTEFVDYYKDTWWFKQLGQVPLHLSQKGSVFLSSLPPPYYKLGVIAGNFNIFLQEHILQGPDDGIVPVESTKVDGMTDFIVIPRTTHGFLKYDRMVFSQVAYFLKSGSFKR